VFFVIVLLLLLGEGNSASIESWDVDEATPAPLLEKDGVDAKNSFKLIVFEEIFCFAKSARSSFSTSLAEVTFDVLRTAIKTFLSVTPFVCKKKIEE